MQDIRMFVEFCVRINKIAFTRFTGGLVIESCGNSRLYVTFKLPNVFE